MYILKPNQFVKIRSHGGRYDKRGMTEIQFVEIFNGLGHLEITRVLLIEAIPLSINPAIFINIMVDEMHTAVETEKKRLARQTTDGRPLVKITRR